MVPEYESNRRGLKGFDRLRSIILATIHMEIQPVFQLGCGIKYSCVPYVAFGVTHYHIFIIWWEYKLYCNGWKVLC